MTGSGGRPARAALGLAPDEPDQVPRLLAFRCAPGRDHRGRRVRDLTGPDPAPNGETVTVRYTFSASCWTSSTN
jgi:hypothetical protein